MSFDPEKVARYTQVAVELLTPCGDLGEDLWVRASDYHELLRLYRVATTGTISTEAARKATALLKLVGPPHA